MGNNVINNYDIIFYHKNLHHILKEYKEKVWKKIQSIIFSNLCLNKTGFGMDHVCIKHKREMNLFFFFLMNRGITQLNSFMNN